MLRDENTPGGKIISMNQYNNQSRSNRGTAGSPYRRNSGKSGFLSVILFYVLPFLVVNGLIFFLVTAKPKGEIVIGESKDYISTTIELKVKSILPLKGIELTLDGTPVEVTKTGSRTYTTVLTSNGYLEAKLTSFNKMKTVLNEQVDILDDTQPAIKDNVIKDGVLSFRLEDSQSGVDFSSVTVSDESGSQVKPLAIDRSTGLITVEIDKENLTVTAKDMIGNELHATFTPDGGMTEDVETGDDAVGSDDAAGADVQSSGSENSDQESSALTGGDSESDTSESSDSGNSSSKSSTSGSSSSKSNDSGNNSSKSGNSGNSSSKNSNSVSHSSKSSNTKTSSSKSNNSKTSTSKSNGSKTSTSKSQN